MDIAKISIQNPWWSRAEAINEDPKLKEYFAARLKWKPRIVKYMPLDQDVIYSVRGPRQIGKTTLVKVLIKELLDQEENPTDILYYACDLIKTAEELYDLLETYHTWSRQLNKGRTRIFLDEISAVEDWQKAIKRFIDQHGNKGTTFFLTSSHSLDIEKSTERLPGRTGEKQGISTHKVLLPMKFAEYVEHRQPALYAKVKQLKLDDQPTRAKELLLLAEGKEPPSLAALLPLQPELNAILDEYLLTGGILFAVNSFLTHKNIPQTQYELYIRQLMGDISRVGREERTAKQIIASIIQRIGSRTSWLKIATENGIPSPPTVPQYVHILESMFILDVFHKIDERQQPKHASEKKIHIINPFMFHALRAWALNPAGDSFKTAIEFLGNTENKSKLIEGVVGDHLARASYNLKPTDIFDVSTSIFYWHTKKGNEIDYILKHAGNAYAFDVTYQNKLNSSDYIALRKFGKGCMISKWQYAINHATITVPVSVFLLYI